MNRKWGFLLALALAAVVFIGARGAEAEIRITIRNNRSHNMSFAFCWAGFDYMYDVSKGWYNVNAGQSRTITFPDVNCRFTFSNFGYYATGGGSTWRGNNGDEYMQFWIHPSKAFTGSHDEPISGGRKVEFRKITLKEENDYERGIATLTFNP